MIRSILNNNPQALNIAAKIYNIIHYSNVWKFRIANKLICKGAFLKKNHYQIQGANNIIMIGSKARVNNCSFTFIGKNCKIIIGGGHTIISNVSFWCQDDNSTIVIGNDFTMEGGHIAATEGELINIGNDCMFSNDVEIRNGDSHSIIDVQTGRRINQASAVHIGNHVWLTAHVKVLKGSNIPSHSVVGNSSVVTDKFEKENALYSGIPCKLRKENIDWDRYKI